MKDEGRKNLRSVASLHFNTCLMTDFFTVWWRTFRNWSDNYLLIKLENVVAYYVARCSIICSLLHCNETVNMLITRWCTQPMVYAVSTDLMQKSVRWTWYVAVSVAVQRYQSRTVGIKNQKFGHCTMMSFILRHFQMNH